MKKKFGIIFLLISGLVSLYALYSLIGYTIVELGYPVLHSSSGNAYFGGNLIMLGVAAAVLIVLLPIQIVVIKKLIGKTHRLDKFNVEPLK